MRMIDIGIMDNNNNKNELRLVRVRYESSEVDLNSKGQALKEIVPD